MTKTPQVAALPGTTPLGIKEQTADLTNPGTQPVKYRIPGDLYVTAAEGAPDLTLDNIAAALIAAKVTFDAIEAIEIGADWGFVAVDLTGDWASEYVHPGIDVSLDDMDISSPER